MAVSHRKLALLALFLLFAMLVVQFAFMLKFIAEQDNFLDDDLGVYDVYHDVFDTFFDSLFVATAFAGATFFFALLTMYPVSAIKPKLWSTMAAATTIFFLTWFVSSIVYMASDKDYQDQINDAGGLYCDTGVYGDDGCDYSYWWNILWDFTIASLVICPVLLALALYSGHITCHKAYIVRKDIPASNI